MTQVLMVNKINIEGRDFMVGKYQGGYVTLELGVDVIGGQIARKLNGVQMHWARDIKSSIAFARTDVKVDQLVAQGKSRFVASCIACGMSEAAALQAEAQSAARFQNRASAL